LLHAEDDRSERSIAAPEGDRSEGSIAAQRRFWCRAGRAKTWLSGSPPWSSSSKPGLRRA